MTTIDRWRRRRLTRHFVKMVAVSFTRSPTFGAYQYLPQRTKDRVEPKCNSVRPDIWPINQSDREMRRHASIAYIIHIMWNNVVVRTAWQNPATGGTEKKATSHLKDGSRMETNWPGIGIEAVWFDDGFLCARGDTHCDPIISNDWDKVVYSAETQTIAICCDDEMTFFSSYFRFLWTIGRSGGWHSRNRSLFHDLLWSRCDCVLEAASYIFR